MKYSVDDVVEFSDGYNDSGKVLLVDDAGSLGEFYFVHRTYVETGETIKHWYDNDYLQ